MTDRLIFLDTETTGFKPEKGDKLVEIAAIETIGLKPTGRVFHRYINPQRSVPEEAYNVHGLSTEFLSGQPVFAEVVQEFCDFIDNGVFVAHNAPFDLSFLRYEITQLGLPLPWSDTICTLALARRLFPGSPASLDSLLSRFNIDASKRVKHGALIDTELLIEVYVKLTRRDQLDLGDKSKSTSASVTIQEDMMPQSALQNGFNDIQIHRASESEVNQHSAFVKTFGKSLWT